MKVALGNIASILRWAGNIIVIIAVGVYAFVVTMPCASCSNWDLFVVPVTLIAIPVLSLLIAIKWPIIAGEALLAIGMLMGWYLHANDIWVIFLYASPAFFAGLFFLISGIYSLLTESSHKYTTRKKQGTEPDFIPGEENVS